MRTAPRAARSERVHRGRHHAARLADGVSATAAETRLESVGPQLARAFPVEYADARVTMAPLPRFGTTAAPRDEGMIAVLGAMLLGLTAAVLLTVCLNLASMLMARGNRSHCRRTAASFRRVSRLASTFGS